MQQSTHFESQQLTMKWKRLREEQPGIESSVDQQQAVKLILKWIGMSFKEQFQRYEEEFKDKANDQTNIKEIVQAVVGQQKKGNLLSSGNKYTFQVVTDLTQKVRTKCKDIIASNQQFHKDIEVQSQELQPQVEELQSPMPQSKEIPIPNHQEVEDIEKSQFLPQIKPKRSKGRVYNPQDMAPVFHLHQQSLQLYQPRSSHLFQSYTRAQNQIRSKIFSNKFLKMIFQRFCKQSYNSHGLFSEFFKESDKMNLNKWMVFCKEFEFNQKFHIKHLIECYQQATKHASKMDLHQFQTAVAILQQKYMDKFHTGQKFVEDVLKINSQAAFRVKMENLKVRYGGPQRNSFEMATYPEHLRLQAVEQEKKFQAKKKERDIVLIQGMYEEHLKSEIIKRKEERMAKKLTPKVQDKSFQDKRARNASVNLEVTRNDHLNYSKIFHIKQQNQKKKTNYSMTKTPEVHPMYTTEVIPKKKEALNDKNVGETVRMNNNSLRISQTQDTPQREWLKGSESIWLTKLRSDSEQSDEILKQHLQLQKKVQQSRQSLKVSNLRKQLQDKSKQVDKIQRQMQEDDADLVQTGMDFKPKPRHGWAN